MAQDLLRNEWVISKLSQIVLHIWIGVRRQAGKIGNTIFFFKIVIKLQKITFLIFIEAVFDIFSSLCPTWRYFLTLFMGKHEWFGSLNKLKVVLDDKGKNIL